MSKHPFTAKDLEALKAWDTPTICNGLEIVAPERRAIGFTVEPMVVVDRKFPPIVGLARTGLIRAKEPARGPIPPREDWYEYVAADDLPTIAVIQDIDDRPGFGAFWGEVQTTVHAGLGVAGCVTNGSFRDIDMLAPGFQIVGGRIGPSHARAAKGNRPHSAAGEGYSRLRARSWLQRTRNAGRTARIRRNPLIVA